MSTHDPTPPGIEPDDLLRRHETLFTREPLPGPVLDLACGDGHNGLFLAARGLPVVLLDRSSEALSRARRLAERSGVRAVFQSRDLEGKNGSPLSQTSFGAILVFRYLHRPLMPHIRNALKNGGLLVYETFTTDQPGFGRPHNPDFLLKPGELMAWFGDWEVLHAYEGLLEDPPRAAAQIVCRKPGEPD